MKLHDALVDAAREFNAGRFFEAHEALEDALDDVPDELWPLFLGLIQVAVGYHKCTQGLWSGAARMLGIGLEKLEPLPPEAGGVRLEPLLTRVRADLDALEKRRFDEEQFRRDPPRLQPKPRRAKRS